MEIKILRTKNLENLLESKRIHITEMMNGILDISSKNNGIIQRQTIELVISQILSDNPDLFVISSVLETNSRGTIGAIAFFVSSEQLCKNFLSAQFD